MVTFRKVTDELVFVQSRGNIGSVVHHLRFDDTKLPDTGQTDVTIYGQIVSILRFFQAEARPLRRNDISFSTGRSEGAHHAMSKIMKIKDVGDYCR